MNGNNCGGERLPAMLYLCATPIGNLADITRRAEDTLRRADRIYCEDTRNSMKLLNALDIKKPLESCHEHNENARAEKIADEVRSGLAVAFISDAGMPGVSDPGARLVRRFIEEGLPFTVLPGANAVLTAWVMSGFSTEKLLFIGFLPRSGAERAQAVSLALNSQAASVIYESPLRVGDTLSELAAALGSAAETRGCALVRELTKTFEECVRGSVSELAERYCAEPPRGECVLVLEGAREDAAAQAGGQKLDGLLSALLEEGVSVKSAARIATDTLGLPKNAVYKRAMELNKAAE